MFVYEVRENLGYDGIGKRFLVKEGEYALNKVKSILIKMLKSSDCPLKEFRIADVNKLNELGGYHSFESDYFTCFEVLKIKVIL